MSKFTYPYDWNAVGRLLGDVIHAHDDHGVPGGSDLDSLVALLADRDRALEDYLQRVNTTIAVVTATSDKTSAISQSTANSFIDVGAGTNLSIAATVNDVLEMDLSGTYYVDAGASGFLSLMVDFVIGTSRVGGSLGVEYETPAALGTSYGFHAHAFHTVVAGDRANGLVSIHPQFGHDVGTGTLHLQNGANLYLFAAVKNLGH